MAEMPRQIALERFILMSHDNPNDRFKARVDLWMHCNTLLWSRLQPLYFIQAAFFALATYLLQSQNSFDGKHIIWIALIFAVPLHIVLIMLALNERADRERQGNALWDEFEFDITTYSIRKPHQRVILFFRACIVASIFIIWLGIDFVVALYISDPALFK
jgi:hypothetical protein